MDKKILLAILIVAFLIRVFYAATEDNLFGSDSYYHYRIALYFKENMKLPETDNLYYGGRAYSYLPLFHIILGLLGNIIPLLIVAKFFPSIAGIFYILICYLIFKEEKKNWIFLFLLATFPVLLFKQGYLLTDNLSLIFIALLILFYKKSNVKGFILTIIIYSFAHLSVLFFSIIFLIASVFNKKSKFFLASLIPFLILMIFFPQQLLNHSENIPSQLANEIYQFYGLKFLILKELSIPIFLGLILFISKKPRFDKSFLFFLLPMIFYPLKLITLDRSLAYSTIPLAYFAGLGLNTIKKRYRLWLAVFVIILSLYSSYLAINQLKWGVMDPEEKEALEFLSKECSVALTSNFGHWITANNCTVFFDDVYTKESEERYDILSKIYNFDSKTLIMLEQNNISHIVVFEATREKFPGFLEKAKKSEFLKLVFDNGKVQIFRVG